MGLTIEDHLKLIRDTLARGNFNLLEVSGSFRVELMPGLQVYIYPETFENIITARFDTRETDPDIRAAMSVDAGQILCRILDFADIAPFAHSDTLGSMFVYTARIDIRGSGDQSISRGAERPLDGEQEAPVNFLSKPIPGFPESPVALSPESHLTSPGIPHGPSDIAVPGPSDQIERAMQGLESLDSGSLRELLDQMYLKRSGKVRVAVSRIFRSFTDRQSLEQTIAVEAKKIISPADRQELQIARSLDSNNPLEPLIELIYNSVFAEK